MDKAVFGLIGAGGIAQSQHLPNLARLPHVRLKTLCDLREDVLRQMQAKYAVPQATPDHRKLLADPEIQAVVVATREDAQADLAIEALRAGKHVYVEKPLANTSDRCAAVAAVQREARRFVAVGFNRRFAPAYRKAREWLLRDGGPKNIHYRISDEYWRWGANYPPGVRVIHELGHVFDTLRWLTGSEVASIYAAASRPDDEAYALKFRSGCVATIMNSGYATMDLPKERLEAISTRGGVTVEDFVELRTYGWRDVPPVTRFAGHTHPDREYTHKYLLEIDGADALHALRRLGWQLRYDLEHQRETAAPTDDAERKQYLDRRCPHWNYMVDKGWLWALDHFARCVLTGETPENASAEDGWRASLLSHAAILSRESGQVVMMD
jgi:predicted dehydrogenase